jgi:uncharacterized membrane protein
MRKAEWFLIVMVVIFFATAGAFYPHLPTQFASHWNAAGQVNGSLSRGWGAFLFPVIFVLIALLLLAIPRIDPRRENIAKFRSYFDIFLIVLALFFYYIYLLMLLWNVGYEFNLGAAIIPPIAALIYIIGMILPHTHPNWFVGIRTPWTISSDAVWHETHRVGGWAFRACGIIAFLGIFFSPPVALWFIVAPIVVSAVGLVIYSYVLYSGRK